METTVTTTEKFMNKYNNEIMELVNLDLEIFNLSAVAHQSDIEIENYKKAPLEQQEDEEFYHDYCMSMIEYNNIDKEIQKLEERRGELLNKLNKGE